MPEFDEDSYKKQNRNDQELQYEPGKNTHKYKSKQPGFSKQGQSQSAQSSKLWVEAATSTNYKNLPPREKSKNRSRNNRKNNPDQRAGKGRNRNRNRNQNRRQNRKPSLWQKILQFFGLAPKHPKRKFDRNKDKKGGNARPNQDNRRQGNKGKPQGKGRGNRRGKPQSGDDNPRADGDNQPRRRKRSRKPRGNRPSGDAQDNQPQKSRDQNNKNRQPRGKGDSPDRGSGRPDRGSGRSDNQRNRDSGDDSSRKSERPAKVESVAAPKIDDSSIALGAIELGGPKPVSEKTAAPKRTGRGGRRNRPNAGKGSPASTTSPNEFVPHPIELPKQPAPKSEEKKSDD